MVSRLWLVPCLALIVGCGSIPKPSLPSFEGMEIPAPKLANPLALFRSEDARSAADEARVAPQPAPQEITRLREQLIYGAPGARVLACNRLGDLAAQAPEDSAPQTLLNEVWQHDPSHEVRMAAAHVLSKGKQVPSTSPVDQVDAGKTGISFLPKFWR